MRSVTAIAVLGLVAAANTLGAQSAKDEATCSADQSGTVLLTTVEYRSGYKIEAPWRVISSRTARGGDTKLTAVLDHIIETDPATRKRSMTPLPGAVEITFTAESQEGILREAAGVWCATVAKALAARRDPAPGRAASRGVVM